MYHAGARPPQADGDKDMFLQLLVAQLRYQDPMNPTDSSEFLAQSAQFTALEKMQDVADQTAALLGSPDGLRGQRAGRQARSPGSTTTATPARGTVDGVTFGAAGPDARRRRRHGPARPGPVRRRTARRRRPAMPAPPHPLTHPAPPAPIHERNPMLRSLFAGISGLRVNQTMLDVTGNNIANANTDRLQGQHHRLPGHPEPDAHRRLGRRATPAAAPTRSRSASASRSPPPAPTSARARPRPPAAPPT